MLTSSVQILDVLYDNPAWPELIAALTDVNDEYVLQQVEKLLAIRVVRDQDRTTVENSIREIGCNLTPYAVRKNWERLQRSFDLLQEWQHLIHTSDWPKYCAMLVDTTFGSTRLYTADYQNFWRTPRGPLITEGGSWYPTTHVELEVGTNIAQSLDLVIRDAHAQGIVEALTDLIGAEAQQWYDDNVGAVPNTDTDIGRAAYNYVLFHECQEFYYKWAPIEDVLHAIIMVTSVRSTMHFGGGIAREALIHNHCGRRIHGREFVYSTTKLVAGAQWTPVFRTVYDDGAVVDEAATCNLGTRIGSGYVFDVPQDIEQLSVVISASGYQKTVVLTLYPTPQLVAPHDLKLLCASHMYSGQRLRLSCTAVQDQTVYEVTADPDLVITTSHGTLDGTTLCAPQLLETTDIVVTATLNDLVAQTIIECAPYTQDLYPVELRIDMPSEVVQGVSIPLVASCRYNDGSWRVVQPTWYSSSSICPASDQVLSPAVRHSDYVTTLVAVFQDIEVVQATHNLKLLAKRWIPVDARLVVPQELVENTDYVAVLQLYWVDADADPQAIASQDPQAVRGWRTQHHAYYFGTHGPDYRDLVCNSATGAFTTPWSSGADRYGIGATATVDGHAWTAQQVVVVRDTVLQPLYMDIVCQPSVKAASSIGLKCLARWNLGYSSEVAATYVVEYEPSEDSAIALAKAVAAANAELAAQGLPETASTSDFVDVKTIVVGTLTDSQNNTADRCALYFNSVYYGMARITASYSINGVTYTEVKYVALSPARNIIEAIHLEADEVMGERTRNWVRAQVGYEDGTTEYCDANYEAVWDGMENDRPVVFSAKYWHGKDLITALSNVVPTSYAQFLSLPCSSLAIFEGVTTLEQAFAVRAYGAIMQIERLDRQVTMTVSAKFFNSRDAKNVLVMVEQTQPVNTIVRSRIEGPLVVSADCVNASYALVNTYQLTGYRVLQDGTELEQGEYQYDSEVSSDWVILTQSEYVDGAPVATTQTVATIDDDGYLSVLRNVDAVISVRAVFNDGYNQFSRDIEVQITKYNQYLLDLQVIGSHEVWDIASLNTGVQYDANLWYMQYGLELRTLDGESPLPVSEALWSIRGPSDLTDCWVDDVQGRLYLGAQKSDAVIQVQAQYSLRLPNLSEQIVGELDVTVRSQQHVVETYIDYDDGAVFPQTDIPMTMFWTRRNGEQGDSRTPVDGVSYSWSLREGHAQATISDGVLRFSEALPTEQVAIVNCVMQWDRQTLVEALTVRCSGIGYCTDLQVSGFQYVRDDSTIQYTAMAQRLQRPTTNETANCWWSLETLDGNTHVFPNISIGARTGVLVADKLAQDTELLVACLYVSGAQRIVTKHRVKICCSLPRYGTGIFGIDSLAEAEANLTQVLNSSVGGTFFLNASGQDYGYFMCRKDYGTPLISPTQYQQVVNNNYGGWDGATWTLTDFDGSGPLEIKKVYDNVVDTLTLYRTNNRAGLLAKFVVRYGD